MGKPFAGVRTRYTEQRRHICLGNVVMWNTGALKILVYFSQCYGEKVPELGKLGRDFIKQAFLLC